MKPIALCLWVALGAALGCGNPIALGGSGVDAGTRGFAGSGGMPAKQSSYRLSCTISTLTLEIPIALSFELDHPYTEGGSVDLTFSASLTLEERTATTLIDAGVSKIDIISIEIAPWLRGAIPSIIETSFARAPINDFDLEVDSDDNGIAGPHTLTLDTVVVSTAVIEGADEVELGLEIDRVSLVLGDFNVPIDCLSPSLVGFSASFPVQ